MSSTTTEPATKTLAELFPLTYRQFQIELANARSRLAILESVEKQLNTPQEEYEFEAVVPQSAPSHIQGKSIGKNIETCVLEARKSANRHDNAFAFVNLSDDISLALSPVDQPLVNINAISQQKEDPAARPRFVWKRKSRGNIWLI